MIVRTIVEQPALIVPRCIASNLTVATNAIIERLGARTGLVTTEGFRDLLEIGRLRLMRLYDMDQERPAPLVRRLGRVGVLRFSSFSSTSTA